MDNNYLQQIQEYLNNNNVKNDANENISLNKNQLLECFQMLLNSKDQLNNKVAQTQKNQEEMNSKTNTNATQDSSNKKINQIFPKQKEIKNFDDMPLPALKNKEKNNNLNQLKNCSNNNIDEIPIKGGANFNELLEKELLKEKNDEYGDYNQNNNVEPKFKYVPKKRNDLVSIPTNTKKYKYYSDNFKSIKRKKKKMKQIQIEIII